MRAVSGQPDQYTGDKLAGPCEVAKAPLALGKPAFGKPPPWSEVYGQLPPGTPVNQPSEGIYGLYPGYAGNAGAGVLYGVEGTAGAGTGTVGEATVDGTTGAVVVGGAAEGPAVGSAAVNDVAGATVVEGVTGSRADVLDLLP